MDRVLTQEFPPALFRSGQAGFEETLDTGWLSLNAGNTVFKNESTIDLGGYTRQDDLTVFFRSSFEQIGGPYSVTWFATTANPLSGFNAVVSEQLIVTSVPLTDVQLELCMAYSPGFQAFTATGLLDFKTGNRNTTIHGHRIDHAISTTTGATSFDDDGEAYLVPLLDDFYSSLDPTAADTLYCYRLIGMSSGTQTTRLEFVTIPPRRIIMDTTVDKESELSYMMRLKRSYELANQV
jgi:hypothetical protein